MRSSLSLPFISVFSTVLFTLTSSLPLASTFDEPAGTFSLELTKRAPIDVTHEQREYLYLGRVAKAQAKFGSVAMAEAALVKRGSPPLGFVQLGDTPDDTSYYATILMGTPPVAFEVALDTGSSDLIIVTDPCYSGCALDTQLYRPQDSSTSQVSEESFSIGYVSGGASGLVEADVVSFGGYTIENQVFGAVNRSDSVVSEGGVSGLLGMAFQPLSATGAMPFVEALWKKNLLAQPVFSFAMARWGTTTETVVPGGIVTIGGTNSTLYSGSINYIASSNDYWSIPLGNIHSGGVSLGISFSNVYIDTGTSEVYFPPSAAASFYANIPGARDFGRGLYAYRCSATNLGISFTFGGVTYPMNDADFNIGYATGDGVYCYGAVGYIATPPGREDQYIFGDAFLKNVYSVFRFTPPAVGFATLANPNNVLHSGYVPVGNGITVQDGGNSTTGTITKSQTSKPVVAAPAPVAAAPVAAAPATPATVVTPVYVAPPVVKSQDPPATVIVPVVVPAVGVIAVSPVAPLAASQDQVAAAVASVLTPVVTNAASGGINGFAALIQDALLSTIASSSLNAVKIITCQPPKVIDRSTQFWTCSS